MLKYIKREYSLTSFALLMSAITLILFHYGFFRFVIENIEYSKFSSILLIISLVVCMLIANAFAYYLFLYLSRRAGKFLMGITFILNSVAVYFVNTYSIIVDESMIGNVLNTNYDESSSFFSLKLVLYIIFMGILPCIFIARAKLIKPSLKKFGKTIGLSLLFLGIMAFANASHWLWIDKHSKQLGGLAMPWSYSVNLSLYYIHESQKNREEILLPDAHITDDEKSIVVLVIGESARSQNFSLYGYNKETNPMLASTENVFHFPATSCATYTTAGVKCILEHEETGELYEILPNYLHRNGVEVIWRTTNSGEPPVHINTYQTTEALKPLCQGEGCDYDEVLLAGLKAQILESKKNKIFIVLHTGTSHGPTYSKKYPARFEKFSPVCNSVELANCTQQELINAYDNTIVYTDYLLHRVIEDLKSLKDYKSTMLFVSDHGESLGEKNLYMHGLPKNFAPKEQYEIPFIVWVSDNAKKGVKPSKGVSQGHVFHSVLHFLSVQSPVYQEEKNIYK